MFLSSGSDMEPKYHMADSVVIDEPSVLDLILVNDTKPWLQRIDAHGSLRNRKLLAGNCSIMFLALACQWTLKRDSMG
jgi:hypothetical protein